MKNLIITWLLNALALVLTSMVVPGFQVRSFGSALIAAIVIGFINGTLGLLLKVVTFPLTLVTLGLFWLVINALMIMIAAKFVDGFGVSGFWAAFFGAIVLALVNMLLRGFLLS